MLEKLTYCMHNTEIPYSKDTQAFAKLSLDMQISISKVSHRIW